MEGIKIGKPKKIHEVEEHKVNPAYGDWYRQADRKAFAPTPHIVRAGKVEVQRLTKFERTEIEGLQEMSCVSHLEIQALQVKV